MDCDKTSNLTSQVKKSISKISSSQPVTHEAIITSTIISIKKNIIKLEELDEKILSKGHKTLLSTLLLIDAKLEMILDEIDEVRRMLE